MRDMGSTVRRKPVVRQLRSNGTPHITQAAARPRPNRRRVNEDGSPIQTKARLAQALYDAAVATQQAGSSAAGDGSPSYSHVPGYGAGAVPGGPARYMDGPGGVMDGIFPDTPQPPAPYDRPGLPPGAPPFRPNPARIERASEVYRQLTGAPEREFSPEEEAAYRRAESAGRGAKRSAFPKALRA